MKRRLGVAGGLAVLAALWAAPAAAQNVTIGADAAFLSHYVWRGLTYGNKIPVIQPDVWINVSGFTVGAWANLELSTCDGTDDLDRKSTRLNSSHIQKSRMPSSA